VVIYDYNDNTTVTMMIGAIMVRERFNQPFRVFAAATYYIIQPLYHIFLSIGRIIRFLIYIIMFNAS
jgi:hypothetical protein